MNETLYLILAGTVGFLLGIFFFGGLWITVKKAVIRKTPAIWFLGSFILRVGVTMSGFYYISLGDWRGMLIAVSGFIVGRVIIVRLTKVADSKEILKKEELSHEA